MATVKIKYIGKYSIAELEDAGLTKVKRGEPIELPAEVAEDVLKRRPKDWMKVGGTPKKKEVTK